MKTNDKVKIEKAIDKLIGYAEKSSDRGDEALRFTQAALNLAQLARVLQDVPD